MRREFIVMAAVVAVALFTYLAWQNANNVSTVQPVEPQPTPQNAAPGTPSTPPAQTPTTQQ
jgi:hypothetical protein